MLSFGGLSIHYSNPQRLFFPDLVKRVSVTSRKPRRFVCCTHLIKRHFYICFLVSLQIPNWDRVESFSNKKESKTRASTSLHLYFMLSDSCTVFLHLYKSIFLPLPSRSPEQCSLWLSGSIKVCQMNRKNHAWRGNEKLSKATWNLKHFFSFSLFFFFYSSLHLASQACNVQTSRSSSQRVCNARVLFCSAFDLFSASGRETLNVNEAALKIANAESERRMKGVRGFFCFSETRKSV